MHHQIILEQDLNIQPTVVVEEVHIMVSVQEMVDMEHLVVVHHHIHKLLRVVD
tara:strand:+ start:305 stop:463 length:159 start_codon:yes stop_codon:yes gene_type:complete